MSTTLPDEWMLGASTFNWTPDIIEARSSATDIACGIVADGVAQTIELEAGSVWRSFPTPTDADVDVFRTDLDAVGGRVSLVGLSLDDYLSQTRRRTEPERLDFLLPQLRAAARVGATGVRLPIGQAGRALLERLLPELEQLDLTLFEELQGQQAPNSPSTAAALEVISDLDDRRVRVLVDISLLMPALPVTYLQLLGASGLPTDFVELVTTEWRDPATTDAVLTILRSGAVPGPIHTLFMNMLIRFGRSDVTALQGILPLVGAFHLKFWDLDDADGRVSQPIAALGRLLSGTGFASTFTSEWGGHEWLEDASATEMTRAHLALAREALARGTQSL